jgi:amino acid transporter
MDLILYGSSLILEFVALAVLRRKEPALRRPFSAGKGVLSACLIGSGPVGLILYAIYAARGERMAHLPALAFGGLIAALGPLLYLLSKREWGASSLPR